MKKLLLPLLLLLAAPLFGQGSFYSLPSPLPNAVVRVCPTPPVGNPCSSPVSIFGDSALTQGIANPFSVGSTGSFGFWVASGQYTIQIAQPYNLTYTISLGGNGGSTTPTSLPAAQGIDATNPIYGLLYDGQYNFNAVTSNGSKTITCATCNFVGSGTFSDVGKTVFVTNWAGTGFQSMTSAVVVMPEDTIATVNSATSITTTTQTATATVCNAGSACFIAWGHIDDTGMSAADAANVAACSTLILPGLNRQGTGPAVMMLHAAHFNNNGNCTIGTGAIRSGFGYKGKDISSTVLMATPNFNAASLPFFSNADGPNIQDLTITGGGVSNPGVAFAAKTIMVMSPANNSASHHVSCVGWGANATNGIKYGIQLGGNSLEGFYIEEDGCGQTGIHKVNSTAAANQIDVHSLIAYDNSYGNVYVDGSNTFGGANQPFNVFGGLYGNSNTGCVFSITGGATASLFGGNYGGGTGQGESNDICVGFAALPSGNVTTSGNTLFMDQSFLAMSGSAGSHFVFVNGATDSFHMSGTTIAGTAATAILTAATAGGLIYDDGGNVITATGTLFTGSGNMIGSASINSPCVAANFVTTSGWGTSSIGTVSGDSHACVFTITGAGVPAAGPVLTYTFPVTSSKPFYVAPRCTLTQTGGTFAVLTNPAHVVTATSDAITFSGTAVAAQTYTFVEACQ